MPPASEPNAPRVNLRMIAAHAGLSLTTVSFALRHSPKIPAATRHRVLRAARELGYRPDPQIAKLMHHLRARRAPGFQSTLAALTTVPEDRWLPYIDHILQSARAGAEALGYKLMLVTLEEGAARRRDIGRMLSSRGVEGLLLLPMKTARAFDELLDWSKFAVVAATNGVLAPEFHRVVPHQFNNMLTVCRHLAERGYRRIGLVEPAAHDLTVQRSFSAAVVWHGTCGGTERVVPLLFEGPRPERLLSWFREERPDAIVAAGEAEARAIAQALGLRIPGPIGFAIANRTSGAICAGIEERPAVIGTTAVRLLASLLQHGEMGVPAVPTVTMVKGEWLDGRSVRSRRVRLPARPLEAGGGPGQPGMALS